MAETHPNTEKPKASAPADFTVKTVVKHNGKIYKPGASLKLTARQAKHLLATKAVEAAK